MRTSRRPELREPVRAFAARLAAREDEIPLRDLAALFGADEALLGTVEERGSLRFRGDRFVNDGPELALPAGRVELEVPNLLRGTFRADDAGFALTFPDAEFTLRACAHIAIVRKCFELRELRGDAGSIELDFGNPLVDRRYEF